MANCVQCGRKLPAFTFGRKLCQWCVQHEAAQRGEEDSTQRVETPPWLRSESSSKIVTQAIFGINVAVFLGMLFAGVSILENPSGPDFVRWGANYGPLTLSGQWWRLLTCVFVHGSFLHIAFNMWGLWNLGSLAESLYGHSTFGFTYLITGVAASVASVAWNPSVLSVGASGAIFGIAGALIASFYLGEFSLPRTHVSGTLTSLVVFAGYSLVVGARSHGIDNAAHIGGLVSGLVLGALIARIAPHRDEPLRRIGVLLVGVLLVGLGVQWLQHARSYLVHAQSGASLLGENKTDEAIREFQTSLRMREDFVPARLELSRAYILKGDLKNAENELQRVIATNPRNEDAYYFLGHVYLEEKQPEQARKIFAEMIKISPSNADGHAGLAEVASFENKYADAVEEYRHTAQLDPGYQSVYHDLGLMQSKLKLYDDAIASFLQQREKGDDPENELALAQAYEAKGMTREAVEAKQRAARFQGQE
jgi:membrane associated rhomboid family serine protease/Tfp pilus assembly protein PilF